MRIIVIAVVCNPNKTTKGYRVLDKDTGEIMNVTNAQVIDVLKRGVPIEGLKLEAGKIKGSNGSLDRYSKINDRGKFIGDTKGLVILEAVDNVGFKFTT